MSSTITLTQKDFAWFDNFGLYPQMNAIIKVHYMKLEIVRSHLNFLLT
jgi:hypothetical protein